MKRIKQFAPALVLLGATALFGQATPQEHATTAKEKAKAAIKDTDVSYGRIKELTAGEKVVIDVDNAIDKSFDLASKDVTVNLAKGLKVGDPVRIREHEVAGKTKSVTITRHAGGGVAHGDKDAAARKP